MTFLAIFISTPDGTILKRYIYHEQQILPDSIISHGLEEKSATLTKELSQTYTSITMSDREDNFLYHGMKFGDINVIAISDIDHKLEDLVQETGWKFLRTLGDIDIFNIEDEIELPKFTEILDQIVASYYGNRLSSVAKPSKYLTPAAVFQLPSELQKIAISMVSLEKASAEDVVSDTGYSPTEVKNGLTRLVEMGYLTRDKEKDGLYYQL